jgi:4-amino-4-deoxy-L-arabinose transferase-like glycosyltransferase
MKRRRSSVLWLVSLTVLADVGLAVPATRYGAAFVLLWLLPGLAWAAWLTGQHHRPATEEIAVGLGLGMGSVVLLTLLLHYVPGPVTLPALLIAVNVLIFFLLLFSHHSLPPDPRPLSIGHWSLVIGLLLVILVAAFFRLRYLGYSEFQGDEGLIMVRAARVIAGDGEQLFYHQKGPAEVLLPVATWTLSGTINEWQARLPFASAGILGVVALYLLGRRWFNERSALVAALLLAINGYFVGFGRIVQYQGLVLATTTLGLLALWRWSEGEGRRWLMAGAALLAVGLLAHYDAGLALPAAAYVVGRRLWVARKPDPKGFPKPLGPLVVDVLGAGALACAILALFYLPFARHPNFAKTLAYLGGARIGTGGPLYNNLLSSLPLAAFYNSAYYLIGLVALLVIASFLPFRRIGFLIPIACYLLLGVLQFAIRNLQSTLWAGPVFATLLLAILLSRRPSPSSRAAWLWFGVPFLFYYFLVWDPRTHVLNVFPGAVLVAASAFDDLLTLIQQLTPPSSRRPASVIVHCSLFILLAYYPYLMFVQHTPEVKRTWPDHQPALYWKPYVGPLSVAATEMPLFGYFGFPYRAGWKVIGALMEEGVLSGIYASNEEQEVTDWYARGAERTYCPDPEWILIARNVQDEVRIQQTDIETAYSLWGEVRVGDQPKLLIYRRLPSTNEVSSPPLGFRGGLGGDSSPAVFHVEDYAPRFDARTTPAGVLQPPPADYTPAGYTLDGSVRLLGYDLNATDARPGGSIHLVLYWEALRPLYTNYQVFNHLYDGTMWGQQDSTPGCTVRPTVLWGPGQVVRDEYTIPIDPSAPVGEIPLLVGMYSLTTEERLPVHDPDGVAIGDSIPLTVVTVR